MSKKLGTIFNCPTEFTLAVLDGKWKTVILCYLNQHAYRYMELRRLIPGLSDKMLTERLRDLMLSGLIVRRKMTAAGRSDRYSLGAKGRALGEVLHHLYTWGQDHARAFGVQIRERSELRDSERKPI